MSHLRKSLFFNVFLFSLGQTRVPKCPNPQSPLKENQMPKTKTKITKPLACSRPSQLCADFVAIPCMEPFCNNHAYLHVLAMPPLAEPTPPAMLPLALVEAFRLARAADLSATICSSMAALPRTYPATPASSPMPSPTPAASRSPPPSLEHSRRTLLQHRTTCNCSHLLACHVRLLSKLAIKAMQKKVQRLGKQRLGKKRYEGWLISVEKKERKLSDFQLKKERKLAESGGWLLKEEGLWVRRGKKEDLVGAVAFLLVFKHTHTVKGEGRKPYQSTPQTSPKKAALAKEEGSLLGLHFFFFV